jgi:membrane-associated HD superfamily phosphohydrolase
MNEIEFLKKRKGMTVANAWMLLFACIGFLIVLMVAFVYYNKRIAQKDAEFEVEYILYTFILIFSLVSLLGIYKINKELPYFKSIGRGDFLGVLLISTTWIIFSTVFDEFASLFQSDSKDKNDVFSHSRWILDIFVSVSFALFQIGVISHGLFKNYAFKKAIFTIFFSGLVFIIPHIALPMAFQGLMFAIIYYALGSFQTVLISAILVSVPEYLFWYFYGIKNSNPIKNNWIVNEPIYYLVTVLAFVFWLYFLFRLYKNRAKIHWEEVPSYENITF